MFCILHGSRCVTRGIPLWSFKGILSQEGYHEDVGSGVRAWDMVYVECIVLGILLKSFIADLSGGELVGKGGRRLWIISVMLGHLDSVL